MSLLNKIITTIETHLQDKKEKQAKAETIAMKAAREYILRPRTYPVTKHNPLYVNGVLITDADIDNLYDETEIFCDVCGVNYDTEDPCPFH